MAKRAEKKLEHYQDARVAATTRIWGISVGMLAICIPLTAITRSSILPLATITGAAVGTVAVWRSDDKKSKNNNYLPQDKVELLEQRIADLETIVSSDDLDLRSKIKQLESGDSQA
ncbi:hypothetical protein WA1_42090 [Scytonema hofmannii PCC 7110]|uniref:Uncharacterized protein n=1 Tax=Scytonema hofmannii PCC 7110 TaxID=128403 RepID=A0A139WV43_9CYAN|nr:hypothetical protein [Scytonema hofmannii]KYC36315.1 hypothetical protein WA1_42090 [Scytonema hofmannii PCC 7110]